MGDLSTAGSGSPAAVTSRTASPLTNPRGSSSRCMVDQPDIVFVSPPDPSYMCPVCDRAMRYPVKLGDCGHRCCSGCLVELVRVAPRCPVDQAKFDPSQTAVDKALQQEIERLAVKCSFHAKGCNWTATLNELQSHAEQCKFYPVACSNGCGAKFERCFMDKHLTNDCPNRLVECDFCSEKIKSDDDVEHLRTCAKFVVGCPNGCNVKDLIREQLAAHLSECPRQAVDCPFYDAGCTFKRPKGELDDHLMSDFDGHQTLVMQALSRSATIVVDKESRFESCLAALQDRADSLVIMYETPLHWRVEGWSAVYRKAKAGFITSVSSPFVSTGRNGFRFCLRVYPFGHDAAQGRFVSVFLTLIRTEMDELLDWPFNKRVSVTLMDQSDDVGSRRHVTRVIDPSYDLEDCVSRASASSTTLAARRPPFGVPQFIGLEELNVANKYIRDDVVFFGVKIDD